MLLPAFDVGFDRSGHILDPPSKHERFVDRTEQPANEPRALDRGVR
jgi:hypothetical protein